MYVPFKLQYVIINKAGNNVKTRLISLFLIISFCLPVISFSKTRRLQVKPANLYNSSWRAQIKGANAKIDTISFYRNHRFRRVIRRAGRVYVHRGTWKLRGKYLYLINSKTRRRIKKIIRIAPSRKKLRIGFQYYKRIR
jgi:hypothetical protein